jgi:hypothetical protein
VVVVEVEVGNLVLVNPTKALRAPPAPLTVGTGKAKTAVTVLEVVAEVVANLVVVADL